jgi:hypothetical protein
LSAPGTRGCIYPFSFYHLHGIFQFFTYGVIFPIGYLVGRHAGNLSVKRPLHMGLQVEIDSKFMPKTKEIYLFLNRFLVLY